MAVPVPVLFQIVHIFALAVTELSHLPALEQLAHLFRGGHKAAVYAVKIAFAAGVHRVRQLACLFHGLKGQQLAEYVFSGFQRLYGKGGVGVGVVGQHHQIHLMAQKRVKIIIIRHVFAKVLPQAVQAPRVVVAYGHQLRYIALFAELGQRKPSAAAQHADSDFLFHIVSFNSSCNLLRFVL